MDDVQRNKLLTIFPPRYPDVIAHHVTLKANVGPEHPLPKATDAEIVGEADDGAGVQALVVRIGRTTDRPGGGTYHITWSLDRAKGRKAAQSNDVIAAQGWVQLTPVRILLSPIRFPF